MMFDFAWSPITLVLVAGALVAIGNAVAVDNRPARWLICFGGALALLAGFYQASEQRKYDTGGDGYCYLAPAFNLPPLHDRRVTWQLIPIGKYPLYDVTMIVSEMGDTASWAPDGTLHTFPQRTISLGRLNPDYAPVLGNQWAPPEDAKSYTIDFYFQARNGSWYENVRFRPIQGGWSAAIKVSSPHGTLLERGTEILDKDPKSRQPIW